MIKVEKIDHLGVAVKSIDEAAKFWVDVMGLEITAKEEVASQKVITAFLPLGESEVELLEATCEDSPIAKFIEKNREGIQHVAFYVNDIEAALADLKANEVRLIDETPRPGAGGKMIAFLHPKATHGVLVELCQSK